MVVRVAEAEMDEMWSFVQSKKQQRWLWHAIDHRTGAVLAYVLAPHTDAAGRATSTIACTIFNSTVLHRQLGCLPAIVRFISAHRWQDQHFIRLSVST